MRENTLSRRHLVSLCNAKVKILKKQSVDNDILSENDIDSGD